MSPVLPSQGLSLIHILSAIPAVRAFLLERQRDMAREHDVIMDGRDIGTVVLPGADVKIFLTASPEDRARRRFDELRKRGQEADYDTVLRDIILRDEHDTRRSAAPLRQAKDADVYKRQGLHWPQDRLHGQGGADVGFLCGAGWAAPDCRHAE